MLCDPQWQRLLGSLLIFFVSGSVFYLRGFLFAPGLVVCCSVRTVELGTCGTTTVPGAWDVGVLPVVGTAVSEV